MKLNAVLCSLSLLADSEKLGSMTVSASVGTRDKSSESYYAIASSAGFASYSLSMNLSLKRESRKVDRIRFYH